MHLTRWKPVAILLFSLSFLLFLSARPAQATISRAHFTAAQIIGGSGTITIPSTTAGNLLVVQVLIFSGSTTVSSITDGGDTFVSSGARPADGWLETWHCLSTAGGKTSVTVTLSASQTADVAIYEYQSPSSTWALDAVNVQNTQAATTTPTSPTVTTTGANDVVISVSAGPGGVTNTSSNLGQTFNNVSNQDGNGWADLLNVGPGTYQAKWTQSPSSLYHSDIVSFKVSSTGGSGLFVQAGTVNLPISGSLTYSCSYPQANQAGNTLILAGRFGTPATWTVSDSQGNAWLPVVYGNDSGGLWYAVNSKAGTNTVTITYSTAQPFQGVCAEYVGLFVVDQSAASVGGTGTTATSSSITTTTNGDLIVGFGTNDSASPCGNGGVRCDLAPGSGFTLRANENIFLEDMIQAVAGPISSSMTYGASVNWNQGVAAFTPKPPGSPLITSLSPTLGPVGTSVTITGTNFGATQGTSTVKFNGTNATPTGWSATSISVKVPPGATTGNVVVTVGGLTSNGLNFTVGPAIQIGTVNQPISGSLTYSCTFPQPNGSGNTLVLAGRFGIPATWTVTDSLGNAWVPAVNRPTGLWYVVNSQAGANTVTITYSQGQPFQGVCVEYSGLFVLDQASQVSSGTGTTATSPSISTTASGNLIIGFGTNDTISPCGNGGVRCDLTPGAGFTLRANENTFIEDLVQTTAGSISSSMTYGASVNWNQGVAAFKQAGSSGGGITYIQSQTAAVGTSGNNTATFSATPTAGDTVVVGVDCYGPTGCSISSLTDNFGNSYSKIGPTATFGGPTTNITNVALYCASGIATGSNFKVTAALSNGSGGDSNLYIAEYSGLTCNVDQSASGSDTGTAAILLQTSSVTTTNAADLLVAVGAATTGGVATPGSGYHLRQNGNTGVAEYGGYEDQTVSATGSYSGSMTLASSTNYWAMVMVALKGSGSGGGAPSVTRISPTSGPVGRSVTITGTNFGTTQGTSTVTFNGTEATSIPSWGPAAIIATVPSGATTGPVVVTVGGIHSDGGNGPTFTVTSGTSGPNITSVTPNNGPVGTQVTIAGSSFGTSQGSGLVWLGSKPANVVSWSDTQIIATVAQGAVNGYARVLQNGLLSNSVPFAVNGCF